MILSQDIFARRFKFVSSAVLLHYRRFLKPTKADPNKYTLGMDRTSVTRISKVKESNKLSQFKN